MKAFLVALYSCFFLSLVSCGGSSSYDDPEPSTGSLMVTVSGLPDGVSADVTITGPGNYQQAVTTSITLSGLSTGAYSAAIEDVIIGQDTYSGSASASSVNVTAGNTAQLTVTYTLSSFSLNKTFPLGLAVAPPTDTLDGGGFSGKHFLSPASVNWTTAYADAVNRINQVLNGELAINNAFTPELFFQTGVNAGCYGPTLKYQDHPDGSLPNSGELPGGDLMMWLETDANTGHTCSAAQLNARLNGIRNQSFAALMSLASMLYVADSSGSARPGVGDTLDLTSAMNALGLTGTSFTTATLSQTATDEWQYEQAYSFNDGTADRNIRVEMTFQSGASDNEYQGLMQFRVSGDNTLFGGGNCMLNERTLNGSLAFERSSETALALQSRSAILCGSDKEGFISDSAAPDLGQVDPNNHYNASTNPDGWSENFNLFGAQLDPNNLEGQYAYLWQAGVGDSHSRVFLMGVNYHESGGTGPLDGEAYAGFGDAIQNSTGTVEGMICNWAGPNNSHTLQPFAQRQFFSLNETTGLFTTPTGGNDIQYAPTNSCSYDGSGSFVYDTDLDGDLSDETMLGAIAEDLLDAFDLDSDGTPTIPEAIENRGYQLPNIPGGFPGTE